MVWLRHPAVAETMLTGLASGDPGHHLEGALDARDRLQDMGFRAPDWEALAKGMRPEVYPDAKILVQGALVGNVMRPEKPTLSSLTLPCGFASPAFLSSGRKVVFWKDFHSYDAPGPLTRASMLKCSECSFCVACGSPSLPRSVPVDCLGHHRAARATMMGSRWSLQLPVCVMRPVHV